ncbi:sugar phosphate isomerase/epimerase [Microbacterium sp. NEAU-LLC]|uniref:Sugar phosphate isomerase/epimerase n=2 Tax=Microbacterium helvum TaxID=2773713 RepID=A0ABR8NWC4_9MICO|nr:sugar phosphate isomerase/epimerase [Microbacterium helvum]
MMLRSAIGELGAYEAIRRTVDVGYRVAELSATRLTPEVLAELRRAQDDFGFEVCSTSASVGPEGAPNPSLETEFDKVVADARAVGAGMVRIGMLPIPMLRSLDGVLEFCRIADDAAVRLADEGIALYYHNHHVEFAKHDGRFLLDIIADASPHVGIELDAHWIQRGGLDPVRVIDQYAGRVKLVHLKDYRIGWPSAETIDALERGDHATYQAGWKGLVQFAEVGEGNLDWPSIISHSLAAGAEYLLVEQDELYGRTVWESLAISRRNLVALGHEALF